MRIASIVLAAVGFMSVTACTYKEYKEEKPVVVQPASGERVYDENGNYVGHVSPH